jgi:hypothetical protein
MLKQIICSVLLLCVVNFSSAGIVEQTFTIPDTKTDFKIEIVYDLFDTIGGSRQLESVEISMLSRIKMSGEAENRSKSSGALFVGKLSAVISLVDFANDVILSSALDIFETAELSLYDGTFDFRGSSGVAYLDLKDSDTDSKISTDQAALIAFTGPGTGNNFFNFIANAHSSVTAGGNFASAFHTSAGGELSIIYTYSNNPINVASPSHLALLGLGLLALAGIRIKTKAG